MIIIIINCYILTKVEVIFRPARVSDETDKPFKSTQPFFCTKGSSNGKPFDRL